RVYEEVHACNIATWPVEADNQTRLNWIGTARKYDWNRSSSRHGCRRRSIVHDKDGHFPPEQVSRQCWQAIVLPFRPAIFDRDVLAYYIASFFQASDKTIPGLHEAIRCGAVEKTDHRHAGPLRARRERPRRRRAAEKRDELAPLHSITSSAMASSVGGTVRPSIWAVLRLITSSN